MKNRNKPLYAAFIDLQKAFPSVSRPLLFGKLSNLNIGNKMFNMIKSMYNDIKSCVSINGQISPMFPCQVGLREGENLSPILFCFYLNDLNDYLCSHADNLIDFNYYGIVYYLQLYLIMYADDTVLLATTKEKLQHLLHGYESYCTKWERK